MILSEKAKSKLDLAVLRVWVWLSDARKVSLTRWAQRSSLRPLFLIAAILWAIFCWWFWGDRFRPNLSTVGILLLAVCLGGWLGWLVLNAILRRSPRTAALWALGCLIAVSILGSSLVDVFLAINDKYFEYIRLHELQIAYELAVYSILLMGGTIQTFCLIATLPLLVVATLQLLLFVLERFVRKIAESPKGAVMALSGIATAIGTILKSFA